MQKNKPEVQIKSANKNLNARNFHGYPLRFTFLWTILLFNHIIKTQVLETK